MNRISHSNLKLLLLLGIFCLVPTFSVSAGDSDISRVSIAERSDGLGYVVRIHSSERIPAHSLPVFQDDLTFSVKLMRTKLAPGYGLAEPEGPIRSFSLRQQDADVIIDFELDTSEVDVSAYRDQGSYDVLISIAWSDRTPNAVEAPQSDRWTLDTIVIDAGHGGKDSGARGPGLIREKDVVLSVALKLGSYLEDRLGVNVVYTRDSDRFITLQGRGHIANQAEGKLFVSIHANSAADARARGTETFFLGLHKSDAAKQVMERENEVIQFEDDPTQYAQIDARLAVMQTLAQSAYLRQSQLLAEKVEAQFRDRVGRRSRGVKQAGFYVLYGASMPAILVELGFISNPTEARFISSDDGQTYLASAIFRAIRDYKMDYEKGLLPVSSGR